MCIQADAVVVAVVNLHVHSCCVSCLETRNIVSSQVIWAALAKAAHV